MERTAQKSGGDILDALREKALAPPGLLRDLRQRAGLTQGDIAKAVGVSVSAVCFWEKGMQFPITSNLPALRTTLGVSYDELIPVLIRTREMCGRI